MDLRILSTTAAIALVLPMAVSTATFAQSRLGSILSATGNAGAGGGPRVGGGGGPLVGSGGGWRGGGGWGGRGGYYPGVAIGGAYASSYYGGYGPGYYGSYGPRYYDDQYYDEGVVAVAPGGDDVAYCRQKYRSYNVRTGTFLGYDGLRYTCP